jgi:hypothetical protein
MGISFLKGWTVKKLVAAFVLGAMLLTIGVGCGGPTTPAKSTDKSKETPKTGTGTEKPKTGT